MNSSYAVDSYRSHDLNIAMKTSSGDVIKMDFANEKSLSIAGEKNANGSKSSMTFSSTQSFKFSIEGNGIDAQDQKEIDAFMKTAQPFIDDFLKELSQDAPKSPVTRLARSIAGIFEPSKDRGEHSKNAVKDGIVKTFDRAMDQLEPSKEVSLEDMMAKVLKDARELLEKTLEEFDNFNKKIYA
jgi:histone H3/H4